MKALLLFLAIGGFFFLAERVIPRRPGQPLLRPGFFTDALYVPVHYLMRVLVSFVAAGFLTELGRAALPGSVPVLSGRPVWLQAVVLVVVLDFFFYVMHRAKHRWHWWWRLHETHHSSERMDFLASVRFHPLEKLLDRFVFLLPLTVLGADELPLLIWSGIDVFFGMMNHSNTRIYLGPLHYVFVGPEMHLWHHARDPRDGECNFGNNLSIFDWIFGTARLPAGYPADYGVEVPVYPHGNIVKQFVFAFRPREHEGLARQPEGAAPNGDAGRQWQDGAVVAASAATPRPAAD
jgi:sterol desaturase/sphingolipid hydroxylase (fatty acid hydroxylase superfamily)